MGRIALLSDELINKIAAGEVVERPASVVKELAENSVDAQARNVRVSLREGGLSAIVVADDGVGMSREDAHLALARHATSKLRTAEGLFQILTKGFRGEALPAIASVSRFSLTTAEHGAVVGTRLRGEGGRWEPVEEVAATVGTTISVEDLFFNVPARRKFMRRDQTELSHCEEAVVRLALAHPEVGFFLEHEGRPLWTSPACPQDPRERLAVALGAEVHPHLIEVDERWLGVRVSGFIASAEYTLPTARGLYCFVNRRYVRDRGLIHAVQRGYHDTLPPGRQPVVVLFLEIDPSVVDVNVHPQKLEVRFSDARGIYDAVHAAVSKAVQRAARAASDAGAGLPEEVPGAHYALAVDRFLSRAAGAGLGPLEVPLAAEGPNPLWPDAAGGGPAFGQLASPGINEAPPPGYFTTLRWLGTVGNRFWVCEGAGGTLNVLDAHAALERLHLAFLRGGALRETSADPQSSLFSSVVELSAAQASAVQARLTFFAGLGFGLEPFGASSFVVRAAPPFLTEMDLKPVLIGLLEIGAGMAEGAPPVVETGMQWLACHAAPRDRNLGPDEIREVLRQLDDCDFLRPCRHAKIVVASFPFLELVRRAGGE